LPPSIFNGFFCFFPLLRGKILSMSTSTHLKPFLLSIALVLMVWFVFGQALTFDFVNYDDPQYVTDNPLVLSGITWSGVLRALTHSDYSFYHPFTTISHMIDFEIYGLNPAGFHFTNVVLHTCSAVILFLLLRSMTGSLWKSFMVAAVFAFTPCERSRSRG
jgi:hypothetical protein